MVDGFINETQKTGIFHDVFAVSSAGRQFCFFPKIYPKSASIVLGNVVLIGIIAKTYISKEIIMDKPTIFLVISKNIVVGNKIIFVVYIKYMNGPFCKSLGFTKPFHFYFSI